MRANQENDESGYFGQPTISYIYQALCAAETIEIVMAEYGAGAAQNDVTEALRKQLADAQRITWQSPNRITIPLSSYNAAFGDPISGTGKQLKVQYRLNGRPGQATFVEDISIVFPVPDDLPKYEPRDAPALAERAELLADAGLYDEALNDLDRLAAIKLDMPETEGLRGRVLADLNRADEALALLNRAVEAGSIDARVYAARGKILLDGGQTEEARADLEKSLELGPTMPAAEALARLLLDARPVATPAAF
ncbi:MAG: hypothetical protein B7Z73_19720, partial [Planctomycetia bacterium 21-64-5]